MVNDIYSSLLDDLDMMYIVGVYLGICCEHMLWVYVVGVFINQSIIIDY